MDSYINQVLQNIQKKNNNNNTKKGSSNNAILPAVNNYINKNIVPYANTKQPTLDTSGLASSFDNISQFNPFVSGLGSFYKSLFKYMQEAGSNRPTAKLRAKTTNSLMKEINDYIKQSNNAKTSNRALKIEEDKMSPNTTMGALNLLTKGLGAMNSASNSSEVDTTPFINAILNLFSKNNLIPKINTGDTWDTQDSEKNIRDIFK